MHHRKDASLDRLAAMGNVAQFVGFAPDVNREDGVVQTYSRVRGFAPNHSFADLRSAADALLARSPERSVNVRSFDPASPRSREFVYGLGSGSEIAANAERLAREGLHVILNETVDVRDGGVSGVLQGGVIEFAPGDTPRCVEKPGVSSLPTAMGMELLRTVYGFEPDFAQATGRIEFSVHPAPRGHFETHTLLWEQEDSPDSGVEPAMAWPNRFSRHIGDKLYGLLMAHIAGCPVPETIAFPRSIAPFAFGIPTGSHERWIRTCPIEQEPGLYTTRKGWMDPFALVAAEDPEGTRIASVLCQHAVPAVASGASIVDAAGDVVVEGLLGEGDLFMLGMQSPEALPNAVIADVKETSRMLQEVFGPVRFEWVHDGERVWTVQLHIGATSSSSRQIVPGERENWILFDVSRGIEALRGVLRAMDDRTGLTLQGEVGLTSHVADLVRKSRVPTRLETMGS